MSTGSTQPFRVASSLVITASTTPATGLITSGGDAALIHNASASVALVQFGAAPADALMASAVAVPAGGSRLLQTGTLTGCVAVALVAGTGSVYVSSGAGSVY